MTIKKGWLALLAAGIIAAAGVQVSAEEAEMSDVEINEEAGDTPTESAETVAEGTCGKNLTWFLDAAGTMIISGEGEMDDYSNYTAMPWSSYQKQIQKLCFDDTVTYIGDCAFADCINLSEVILPEQLTSLGRDVFAFCKSLKNIVLPSSLESVGSAVFAECTSLTAITVQSDIDFTGEPFSSVVPLRTLTLSNDVTVLPDVLHRLTLTSYIVNDTDGTGYASFNGVLYSHDDGADTYTLEKYPRAKSTLSYTLPDNIQTVVTYAFSGNTYLTKVVFPESLNTLQDYAFSNCTSLTQIRFTGDAPGFWNGVFSNVNATVYYPAGNATWTNAKLQYYGGSITWEPYGTAPVLAQGTCGENLTWVLDSAGTLTISGTGEMTDYYINEDKYTHLNPPWYAYASRINRIVVEEGVTSIGKYAFSHCQAVTIDLPDSLKVIQENAFQYCDKLTDLVFPAKLEYLYENVFFECDSLVCVTLPNAVTCDWDSWSGLKSPLSKVVISDTVTKIPDVLLGHLECYEYEVHNQDGTGYFEQEGVLFYLDSNDKTYELVKYPQYRSDKSYTIPEFTSSFGNTPFESVNSLEIVTIPSSVTEFQSLLYNCDNLKLINLPDTLTSISYQAINNCDCLSEIIFPKSLNHLGRLAFQDNYFLETAYFKGNAPEIEKYAFEDVSPIFTIYYNEFASGWSTPEWNGFAAYPYTPDVLPDAYIAGLSSKQTAAVPGDTVYVNIDTDWGFYNTELTLSFYGMEFNPDLSRLNGAEVTITENKTSSDLYLSDFCGNLHSAGTVYTLAFTITEDLYTSGSVVKLHNAAFSADSSAASPDLIKAKVPAEGYGVDFVSANQMYKVTLPEIFDGNSRAVEGKSYTFRISEEDGQYYDYGTVTATMSGKSVKVTDNGDGSYTVENVTGDLVITGERTPKKYTLIRYYPDPWEDVVSTIQSTDAKIISVDWYEPGEPLVRVVSAQYADGTDVGYSEMEWCDGIYNELLNKVYRIIYGFTKVDWITQDVTIRYEKIPETTAVCLDNLTDCEVSGYRKYVNAGEAYSFELLETDTDAYYYAVTVMVNNEVVPVAADGSVYTIAAEDVAEGLILILVEKHPLCTDGTPNHSFTNYVSNENATCRWDGTKTAVCDNGCGVKDTVIEEGTKLEHSFTKYVKDADGLTETAECDRGCGETYTREYLLASDVWGDTLTWKLSMAGTLTISGEGELTEETAEDTWWKYRTKIKKIVIEEGVTGIGKWAFSSFSYLTDVTLPDTVASIGYRAFYNCSSLQNYYVNDTDGKGYTSSDGVLYSYNPQTGKYTLVRYPVGRKETAYSIRENTGTIAANAFDSCDNLEEVIFPEGLFLIGEYAFGDCSKLRKAILPDGLLIVRNRAFLRCTALSEVVFPDTLTSIGECAFEECESLKKVILPDGLKTIGMSAFTDCYGLEEVIFNDDLTSIGVYAFSECESLKTAHLPEGLIAIEANTFYGCESLFEVTFPSSLTTIGKGAFNSCSSLEKVVLPNSLKSMDGNVFRGCPSLKEFQVCDTDDDGYTAIDGVLYFYDKESGKYQLAAYPAGKKETSYRVIDNTDKILIHSFLGVSGLTEVIFPESLIVIGTGAFNDCSDLTEIILPKGLDIIEGVAFAYCDSLIEVVFPREMTLIEFGAFMDCTGLTKVVFEGEINTIEPQAFSGCENLKSAYFYGNAPTIGVYGKPATNDDIFSGSHEEFTIYYNSAASSWSTPVWNGYLAYPFTLETEDIIVGDIDGDGRLTESDSLYLTKYWAGHPDYSIAGIPLEVLDLDFDGIVTQRDKMILERHLAGWKGYETLPIAKS